MSRGELERALRERRRELRRQLPRLRREGRERVSRLPVVRQARARRQAQRWRRRALLVALLLLLACLRSCVCTPGSARVEPGPPKPPVVAAPTPPPPEPLRPQVPAQRRPGLRNKARNAPSWLDDFYLQVSARGPRLSECFRGVERPGGLRWSAAVNPSSGVATDHELELVGSNAQLGREQRECVVGVLTQPRYRLPQAPSGGLPNRLGLLIEF